MRQNEGRKQVPVAGTARMGSFILGTRVDAGDCRSVVGTVIEWVERGGRRYLCAADPHLLRAACESPELQGALAGAGLVVPDNDALVQALQWRGFGTASRVRRRELLERLCEEAERRGWPVGFYGGYQERLEPLVINTAWAFSRLKIGYAFTHPAQPWPDRREEERIIEAINSSGTGILFVGCPDQERWMHQRRERIIPVMVGMGVDFSGGLAPAGRAAVQPLPAREEEPAARLPHPGVARRAIPPVSVRPAQGRPRLGRGNGN